MRSTSGYPGGAARPRAPRLAGLVLGGLLLAGCGGQSAQAPGSTTPAPTPVPTTSAALSAQVCSAAAEYQTAANALVELDATKVGTDGVRQALENLRTAASDLADATRQQFGPQVAELDLAVDALRGTIAGLSDQDPLSTNLGKIAASVAGVEQAAKPIVDDVRAGCPAVPTVQLPPAS